MVKRYIVGEHEIILDDEDFKSVTRLTWTPVKKGKNFYFINNKKTRKYLHQFIIGSKEGFIIDHINQNTLDNRKKNLRHTDKRMNSLNVSDTRNDNVSGFELGLDDKGERVKMSDTQRYKQMGNAVTTKVIAAVGVKL